MLPTFIIIGSMKCGTSSLYAYLKQHPDVFMARAGKSTKTIHFFAEKKNFHKGVDWYESLFEVPFYRRYKTYKAYGEASGTYSKYPNFPNVPKNMHGIIPEAKLIYLVRDPIDRILSHYSHRVLHGRHRGTLVEELKDFNVPMVHASQYYMQIEQYLPFYPRDQIKVVSTENMRDHRKETLRDIFGFIDVDDTFYSDKYEKVHHRSVLKARPLLDADKADSIYNEAVDRTIDPELLEKLKSFLQPDVDKLREFTDQSFSQWRL